MKTNLPSLLMLILWVPVATSCGRAPDSAAKVSSATTPKAAAPLPVPAPAVSSPATMNEEDLYAPLVETLKYATYADRDKFGPAYDQADRRLEARLGRLKGAGRDISVKQSETLDSARQAAMEKFRDLSLATEETWNSSRDNALAALQKVQGVVEEIQSGKMNP
jgi:hypothetical protein